MRNKILSLLVTVPVLLFLSFQLGGCSSFYWGSKEHVSIGEVRHTLTVSENTRWIALENNVGDITVEVGKPGIVEIVVQVQASEKIAAEVRPATFERDISAESIGGTLRLENAHLNGPDSEKWHMDWQVRIPAQIRVSIKNGVGDIRLQGLAEEQSIRLGVGDIRATSATITGRCSFQTGTGDIHIQTEAATGALDLESGVGDITLALPATFRGGLDLEIGVGKIRLQGAEPLRPDSVGVVGAILRGKLGEGSSTVHAKTGVGDITFSRGN